MSKQFALTLVLFAPKSRGDHNTLQAGEDTLGTSSGGAIFERLAARSVEKSRTWEAEVTENLVHFTAMSAGLWAGLGLPVLRASD